MVLEVTDLDALTGTALESIAAEYGEPVSGITESDTAEERMHAEATVRADGAEALASLIDPFDLVNEVPGVELAQASWSSESVGYDPDAEGWDDDEDDEDGPFVAEIEDDEEGYGDAVAHNGRNDGEDGDLAQRV
ncbi:MULTISPECIES: hypothetical protein [unclassified Streptomyces]|uniref:hypothetical protein n=1 Tax=unclassified Streptomyces TaxID=2593676 RepID=UPI00093BBF0B|nr:MULTISPECIES: hypothetical protein [unclassified Streptomyces]MBT2381616.1 hypothetical protein [Streptomyces sp. ISL-111]MBT2428981.1 hypothetical protein [Streptomyces sp. ISL-112]MBT2464121.1 hypothetical protein [Streptomyces sp. ISL-63]